MRGANSAAWGFWAISGGTGDVGSNYGSEGGYSGQKWGRGAGIAGFNGVLGAVMGAPGVVGKDVKWGW